MPIPIEYTVDDVIAMLKNDKSFWGANIYMSTDWSIMQWCSVDEELGTIDNLSRNQLETEGESTVLRWPDKCERNGGYEQPEVTSKDTSEDITASADADVTSSGDVSGKDE